MQEEIEDYEEFEPTPIVQDFLERKTAFPDYYAMPVLGRFNKPVTKEKFSEAMRQIRREHVSLRSVFRYEKTESKWMQTIRRHDEEFKIYEFTIPKEKDAIFKENEFINACSQLEKIISLTQGPTFVPSLLTYDKMQYFFLVAHHTVVDIVSWDTIIEDLNRYFFYISGKIFKSNAFTLKVNFYFFKF